MELTSKQIQLIQDNLEEADISEQYDEMLDDCYGTVSIAGLKYETSSALKELDKIAYDVGMRDYESALESDGWLINVEGVLYFMDQVTELLENNEVEGE